MAIKQMTSFDSSLVVADTQTVATTTEGRDASAAAIEIDTSDFINEPLFLNVAVDSVDNAQADETYSIDIESSNDAGFGTAENIRICGQLEISRDADDNSHHKRGFTPTQNLTRINIVVAGSSPEIIIDKAWITTAQ